MKPCSDNNGYSSERVDMTALGGIPYGGDF